MWHPSAILNQSLPIMREVHNTTKYFQWQHLVRFNTLWDHINMIHVINAAQIDYTHVLSGNIASFKFNNTSCVFLWFLVVQPILMATQGDSNLQTVFLSRNTLPRKWLWSPPFELPACIQWTQKNLTPFIHQVNCRCRGNNFGEISNKIHSKPPSQICIVEGHHLDCPHTAFLIHYHSEDPLDGAVQNWGVTFLHFINCCRRKNLIYKLISCI